MLGIYTRLSREDDKSTSIENQLREGKEFADSKHFNSYWVYNEGEGSSGTLNIEKRPQLFALVNDVKKGRVKAIWMRNQNRLDRNTATFYYFVSAVKEAKIPVFFGDGDEIDFNDPTTLLQTTILSSLNQYTAQLQSKQTKRALRDNVQEGRAHGITAYGYTTDDKKFLIIDEAESKIVRKIFAMSLEGKGQRTLVRYLNDNNIPTRLSKMEGTLTTRDKYTKNERTVDKKDIKWAPKTVHGIIKNPIYKGERQWDGDVYKAPIIIEPELWDKVNANLKNNRNSSGKNVDHQYMLKGLIRCALCGRNYYGRRRTPVGTESKKRIDPTGKVRKDKNYYTCISKRDSSSNCGNKNILLEPFEDFIWSRFFKDKALIELIRDHFQNNGNQDKIQELTITIKELNNKLSNYEREKTRIVELLVKATIDEADYNTQRARIETGLTDTAIKLSNNLEQLQSYRHTEERLHTINTDLKALNNISYIDKRKIVHTYIKDISIMYLKPWFSIAINFHIEGLPLEIYMLDHNYTFAINADKEIFIPLSDELKGKDIAKGEWDEVRKGMDELLEKAVNRNLGML